VEVGATQVDVGGGVQAGFVEVFGFWVVGAGACPPPPPPLKDQDIWKTPAPGSCLSAHIPLLSPKTGGKEKRDIRRSN
jgi:hypothetical protein